MPRTLVRGRDVIVSRQQPRWARERAGNIDNANIQPRRVCCPVTYDFVGLGEGRALNMTVSAKRTKRNKNNLRKNTISSQSLVPTPRGNLIPSSAKRIERVVQRISGSSFTNATTAGYSYFVVDSTQWANASPWTALSGLYMYCRPLYARITVTACRATGTSDNPVVAFVATPDGNQVASAAMSLNTFEAPTSVSKTLGPGQEVSYTFKPYVLLSAYAPVANGYVSMLCPRTNINSLPRIYYGDILISTPGVNIVTTANYLQTKIEYVMEFDTIDSSLIQ